MADLSHITLPDNSTYNFKDEVARGLADSALQKKSSAGIVYSAANATATSAATASQIVSAIGNAAVARATSDANGNTITSTYVPTTRKINGKALSSDITLTTNDVSLPMQAVGTAEKQIGAFVNVVRPNRLALLPADQIIIEKTIDGGSTWSDAGVSDANKLALFAGNGGNASGVYIPKNSSDTTDTNCGLRITITGMKYNVPSGTAETNKYNYWNSSYIQSTERYVSLDTMWFWLSSVNGTIGVKVQVATGANPNNWINVYNNTDFGMAGWSGSDWIRFNSNAFGGGTNQTGNYWNWRILLFCKTPPSGSYASIYQSINRIQAYGFNGWTTPNNLVQKDTLYSYDTSQNATFPAKVTATEFVGNLTGSASKVNNHTVETDVPSGAVFTDHTYDAYAGTPSMDGNAYAGSTPKYSRGDHVHPTDTSRASASALNSHTSNTTVHITANERTAWNAKYTKPSTGIPSSDLAVPIPTPSSTDNGKFLHVNSSGVYELISSNINGQVTVTTFTKTINIPNSLKSMPGYSTAVAYAYDSSFINSLVFLNGVYLQGTPIEDWSNIHSTGCRHFSYEGNQVCIYFTNTSSSTDSNIDVEGFTAMDVEFTLVTISANAENGNVLTY